MAAFLPVPAALGVRMPACPELGRATSTFGGVRVPSSSPPHLTAVTADATAAPPPAVASATPVPPAAPLTRRSLLRTASAAAAAAAMVATGVVGRQPGALAPPASGPAVLPAAPVPLWVRTVPPAAVVPTAANAVAAAASSPPLPVLVFTEAATPAGYTATLEAAAESGRAVTSVVAAAPSSSPPTAVAAAAAAADLGRGTLPGGDSGAPSPRVHVVGGGAAAARAAVAYAAAAGRGGVASLTLEAPRLGADAPADDAAWAAVLADVYGPTGSATAVAAVAAGVPPHGGSAAVAADGWTVATPAAAAGPAATAAAAVAAAVPGGDYRAALADLTAAGLPVAVVRSAADADVTVWVANVPAAGVAAPPRAGPWACTGAVAGAGGTRTEAWGGWHSAAAAERAAFVAALGEMYDRVERA